MQLVSLTPTWNGNWATFHFNRGVLHDRLLLVGDLPVEVPQPQSQDRLGILLQEFAAANLQLLNKCKDSGDPRAVALLQGNRVETTKTELEFYCANHGINLSIEQLDLRTFLAAEKSLDDYPDFLQGWMRFLEPKKQPAKTNEWPLINVKLCFDDESISLSGNWLKICGGEVRDRVLRAPLEFYRLVTNCVIKVQSTLQCNLTLFAKTVSVPRPPKSFIQQVQLQVPPEIQQIRVKPQGRLQQVIWLSDGFRACLEMYSSFDDNPQVTLELDKISGFSIIDSLLDASLSDSICASQQLRKSYRNRRRPQELVFARTRVSKQTEFFYAALVFSPDGRLAR